MILPVKDTQIHNYKGFSLHVSLCGPISDQCVIYKDSQPIGGTFSELESISAYEKAIAKIDSGKYL